MLKRFLKKYRAPNFAAGLIRAYIQELKAKRSLAYYQIQAARKGIVALKGADLRRALVKRLAQHRAGYAPKSKGNLHIFLAYNVSNWEAILPYSLEPFGKVTAFNWLEHGFDHRNSDWLNRRAEMNSAMLNVFHEANRRKPVDAVVGYLSGDNTSPETLTEMSRSGAVIFNFCWDDKLKFPGEKRGGRYRSCAAIAQAVDLNLTNTPDSVIKYAVHGGLAMFWPEAGYPGLHHPHHATFDFDVSFIGACYGWRPRFIKRLDKRGISVECFGPGWPNGSISTEEMVKLYSRSRINLGFAGIGQSRKLMCLKGRDFEVPMSGGLYLTQHNPELSLVFEVGREIVTYKNELDCAHKIRELLDNRERAAAIRKAGRERALRDHTYEARWSQIFQMAGILKENLE